MVVAKMKPHEVLRAIEALRNEWRKQNLTFTTEQKSRYRELVQLRRERVGKLLYDC